VEFLILGELEVRHDGREVPISGMQQRKALAVLLLESGRTVSMHRLIEALWSGEPPATARRQVRNIVAALRRSLAAADPIERSGDGYRLRTDATDWSDFRIEVAKAKAAGECAETHRMLRRALQLWRGPVLAGLDCDFIAVAALGMEEERLAALEDLQETSLALGRHRDMLGQLQSLVAEHPFRQRLNGHLMLALYRSGNGAAALQVYTELGERLADELGIEPDRRLRDLYVAILREDPSLDLEPQAPDESATPLQRPAPAPSAASIPAPEPTAVDTRSSSRRSTARLIAVGLSILVMVLGTSGDGFVLLLAEGIQDRMGPAAAASELHDPLWTYPAMESGSAVMKVEAGLLILDGSELRLESGGDVLWSKPLGSQSIPGVAVFEDMIVLSLSSPIDQPWSSGAMTGISVESGRELWSTTNRWPVGRTGDAIIVAGCEPSPDGGRGECAMESVDPRYGRAHWRIGLDRRAIPLRTETPYGSPWDQIPSTDYLSFRTYPESGEGHSDQLSVYDTATGTLRGEFDYGGVEGAKISGHVLILDGGSTPIAEGRCERRVSAYDLGSGELLWERFVDTAERAETGCQPAPLEGEGSLFPATLQQTASVVWLRSGELQWSAPEPSTAELLIGDSIVTTDSNSESLSVWDVWTHDRRWTEHRGEMMWARGSTLWVLDREETNSGCGGMIGYSILDASSMCLPGSLVYLGEDEVVTVEDGAWQAWPADPWG
jgi:DNA-binding SARP family transcriptional activator